MCYGTFKSLQSAINVHHGILWGSINAVVHYSVVAKCFCQHIYTLRGKVNKTRLQDCLASTVLTWTPLKSSGNPSILTKRGAKESANFTWIKQQHVASFLSHFPTVCPCHRAMSIPFPSGAPVVWLVTNVPHSPLSLHTHWARQDIIGVEM